MGLGLRNIIISLSAAGWVVYARVVRGEVLSVKQREYVHAAAALGVGRARLLFRHVLPNVAALDHRRRESPVLTVHRGRGGHLVPRLRRAAPDAGLGEHALGESRPLYVAWWLAAFPGAALALTALGINLVGDWLRDVLDPKFRV